MTDQEVRQFVESVPRQQRPATAESLARMLVQTGLLTKYQAQAVYQGKTKGLVFGEYVVLDKLGEGGMGVVLKAQHRRMKRFVAVKMIAKKAIGSPDAVKRFFREVEAAAKLNHPNIVAAYDASERDGIHYLVMEYVEGKDLAAIMKDRGPMAVNAGVECILQAARGLQFAHRNQIVHRDIKPSNLLLAKDGTIKILDLGLASVAGLADDSEGEHLTSTGQMMGTCDYMAPEQALDAHHADARADIYSLGCTLYRLLTGHAPYKGESLMQILLAHRESPIPPLSKDCPDAPPQLETAYQKMVAKDPEDRYQTMTEVIAVLEKCLADASAPTTPNGAEPTAGVTPEDKLRFEQRTSPLGLATAVEKKVERLAEETVPQHAAAAETSRPDGGGAKLRAVARRKKTLAAVIGLGLLGVAGIIALTVIIRIHHSDGPDTSVTVPEWEHGQCRQGWAGGCDAAQQPRSNPKSQI